MTGNKYHYIFLFIYRETFVVRIDRNYNIEHIVYKEMTAI